MTEQPDNIVLQINTMGGDHKAVVQRTDDKKFSTVIYEWNEEKTDADGLPVWEKLAGPFILDTQELAEKNAQEHLEIFSLEIPDPSIEPTLTTFIEELLKHKNFKFFIPSNFEVECLTSPESDTFEKITPEKVLFSDNFCFVESEGKWIAGILAEKGMIKGWQTFNDLKSALSETIKSE